MVTSLESSALDETLEAPLASAALEARAMTPQKVALVEGSLPHLTAETQAMLRNRLRVAALLMGSGLLAFLLRSLFLLEHYQTALDWIVLAAHVTMTLVCGLLAVGLWRRCPISLNWLRLSELLLFGGSALLFLLVQYTNMTEAAAEGFVEASPTTWVLLIFTYSLFVPNRWQRAAVVVGIMALMPIVAILYVWGTTPQFAQLLTHPRYAAFFTSQVMYMTLVAAVATVGVAMIGSLRRQVFVAKQLGQYRLKRLIGTGGMGEVYLGEHQLMKRPCAIKVIRPEKAGDPQVLARFEREVQQTSKLSHWNTIEIFDYGRSEDGTFYYVMEYLPGLSLAELVERHGPLPPERTIHLLMQTCDALREAHAHQLVHRDLKPGNIFAAHRGGVTDVVKLLDFGLVKPLAEPEDAGITQDGTITGSPLFMSPEQAAGDDQSDPRSDIYSLGAVAYYLLTGRPPFSDPKPLKVLVAHLHESVPPPSQFRAGIPEDLEAIVLRCLAKKPEDRFQDAEDLRQALASCELAGRWDRQQAAQWWQLHGCPKKQALDAVALHTAAGAAC